MRIRIAGEEQGKAKFYEYNLFDRTDRVTGTLSMARTTGYTCTAVVNLILEGRFTRKGIMPPEYLGEAEADFMFIINYLSARGVTYRTSVS